MNDRDIYFRTEQGAHEVTHRSKGLNSVCRHLLILVNGKLSVGDLVARAPDSWDVRDKLSELERLGFITTRSSIATGADSHGVIIDREGDSLSDTKLALVTAARNILGDGAEAIVERLEDSADDDAALLATIDSCVKLVTLTVSESKAVELRRALEAVLAGAES